VDDVIPDALHDVVGQIVGLGFGSHVDVELPVRRQADGDPSETQPRSA
jgi:hypothetical protein